MVSNTTAGDVRHLLSDFLLPAKAYLLNVLGHFLGFPSQRKVCNKGSFISLLFTRWKQYPTHDTSVLEILGQHLVECLRMLAGGAFLRRFGAFEHITAVGTVPFHR